MKKVITYGSFDLFHEGHYRLLKRAKELGDYLIVGVTTEQFDESRGKLNIVDSIIDRIEHVKQTGFADEIIIEDHVGQKIEDILKHNIDIFTVGSDWAGKFDHLREYCDVIYLERTKGISSTMLRANNFNIIRVGIIGSGRIANRFIPEAKYVNGLNVESVYNPNLLSAKNLAERYELNLYTDDINVFYDSIDAVYIASPHNSHYEYIKSSLNNGKHVLCEKPMVLKKSEAEELFEYASNKNLILMEAIKTAYTPGFIKLIGIAKSGEIGAVRDVEACFTKLVYGDTRELRKKENGGSFTELASYPLLAIIKFLGTDFKEIHFDCFTDAFGVDLYTKAYFYYENSIATAKVGLGVKSEGQLIISGTNGYILTEAPWWKTQNFEIRHEDYKLNEKFYAKFLGDGLRYEISDFISLINGNRKKEFKLTAKESIVLAGIMENFIENKNKTTIKIAL